MTNVPNSIEEFEEMYHRNLANWMEISPGLLAKRDTAYKLGESRGVQVFPEYDRVFTVLEMLPPEEVRVVIVGQDPYHTPGKASGIAFGYHSTYDGVIDSSLRNILDEVVANGYVLHPNVGPDTSLEGWVTQGVLLINTRLTVENSKPLSHSHIGWEYEVRRLLKFLAALHDKDIAWMGWGNEAQQMLADVVDPGSANVFTSSHPCKFSNTKGRIPFTGSKMFSRVNAYLQSIGKEEIKWNA